MNRIKGKGNKMKKIKIWGIRSKLIIYFSILILVSSISLGLILLQRSSEVVTEKSEESLELLAEEASKLTVSRVETQQKTLDMLSIMPNINSMDWEIQQPILQDSVKNTNFLDIAIVTPDGDAHYSNGNVSQLGDRDYVKKALNGESNVSDLIISRVTNEVVLMYAAPIEKDGKVIGALVGRSDGNSLSMIADDTGFGDSGYGYMIDNIGTIVAHPDREKVMTQFNPIIEAEFDDSVKSLATLFEKVLEEKTGVSNYSYEGVDLNAGFTSIEGTNWSFIITANQDEVLSAIPEMQKNVLNVVIISLIVSVILVGLIGNSIASPIVKAAQLSKRIADLDITEDVPAKFKKKKDEIGDLSNALQVIIDSLRNIINEISNTSEQVLASSEELSAASQQSATAAEQVSQTVEEIAKGAFNQAQSTEEGSTKSYELGRIIENDQEYVKSLNDESNKVTEVVDEGLKEIDNLYKITEESNEATNEIKEVILKTNDSSSKIGQASTVISTIAQQTNLLALNAAIEAARAGNAGKGFAVVAEEIKNLAQQSASSTKEIDEIVNELQINTLNAVNTMERILTITEQQTNSVVNSKDKYKLIKEAMMETEETVKQLNASGDEMEKMKDQILATMEDLSAIAEENSAATQEATASIEEQAASSEEIAGSSEGLSTLAQNLQTIIAKFKI
ncbi:methyl-accepting chemotaxis protein [Sedimentibacter sp. MB31-C6]|uniref:methyl-accepting chemotaxis protein n=1 Tax=Sedimentibacter sp. MB31-C6 TaxID=3109366 RepID=UPI002DDD72B1|nr:methyl-accepting chemotaxis protein [Sedimentibacter sp. MB36-C1]WSI04850.1 methyl-accepting chemotaxis protein [Sedimentibacter sp. MB36-C1]